MSVFQMTSATPDPTLSIRFMYSSFHYQAIHPSSSMSFRRLLTSPTRLRIVQRVQIRNFTMSTKKQEPKILETTDYQPEGFKWTRLKKIDWEDETGRKVRFLSLPFVGSTGADLVRPLESLGSSREEHKGKKRSRWYVASLSQQTP
jgi:hypothetical protein